MFRVPSILYANPLSMPSITKLSRKTELLFAIVFSTFGELAQLGERMTGSHEVRGSIPLFSTTHSGGGISRRFFLSFGLMAQRLAQGTHNPWVGGSNPSGPTTYSCGEKLLRVSRHSLYCFFYILIQCMNLSKTGKIAKSCNL